MKKTIFVLGIALCAGFLFAGTASAQTACFDWACGSQICDFDASCSSASPYIWKYELDYGDGSGSGLSSSPTHTHTYGPTVWEIPVELTIYFFSGSGSQSVTCNVRPGYWPVGPRPPGSSFQGRCTN